MNIVITNLSSTTPLFLGSLYTSIPAGGSVSTTRSASDLANMRDLQEAIAASQAALTATPTAAELASGLLAPPSAVQAGDVAPVASTALVSAGIVFRKSFAAGGGGAPDDVTVYAVNTLPYKVRILDAYALILTAVAASTLSVRSAAAGGGTLAATIDSAATGRSAMTGPTASVVLTPGASVGLFIRRSDSGVAGEVMVLARRED